MIIMLEGISKCGKTSWYQRNLPKLREMYGTVTYFHPHMTPVGSMLKELWVSGEMVNEELAPLYLGMHLSSLSEIERLNKKFDCVIVDRTIMSTMVINLPDHVKHEREISGLCEEDQPWGALFDYYFARIANISRETAALVFFNCSEPRERYEKMFTLNSRYSSFNEKSVQEHCLYHLVVDASKDTSYVDATIESFLVGISNLAPEE